MRRAIVIIMTDIFIKKYEKLYPIEWYACMCPAGFVYNKESALWISSGIWYKKRKSSARITIELSFLRVILVICYDDSDAFKNSSTYI